MAVGSIGVDFDFARYIALRQGAVIEQARGGAVYGYSGERKVRRTLAAARPVTMALEATTRFWRDTARAELLGTSVKVTGEQYPRVYAAARRAGAALGVRVPPVFVAPARGAVKARVLGTEDAHYLVVGAEWADALTEDELTALLGHELAHVQNGHVLYATSLYYLSHSAIFFVRWIVQPAIMALQAWSRRAEITCDRAALVATRDLGATLAALVKVELGIEKGAAFNLEDYLREQDAAVAGTRKGLGRYNELFRSHPYLPKRVAALRLFGRSALYASLTGASPEGKLALKDVDAKVGELISVF